MLNPKLIFVGSPKFAIPSLNRLLEEFNIMAVITQPDKPAGRGKEMRAPVVKTLAIEKNIEVLQPIKMNDPAIMERIELMEPDLIVVVAFGQLLRKKLLNLPKFGVLNVHPSLLPRWRGASPIQSAILAGDEITGVTVMQLDPGLDSGPILSQSSYQLQPDETGDSLSEKLSYIGADLLVDTIPGYLKGEIKPVDQPEVGITMCERINKVDGCLDFNKSSLELSRLVRAYHSWPGAFMELNNDRLIIIECSPLSDYPLAPGERHVLKGYPIVGTGEGALILRTVQPAGKKPIDGKNFLNGYRHW